MSSSRVRFLVGAMISLVTLSGCTRQSVDGDSVTYGYGWFVILLILAVSIAVTAIGAYRVVDNRRLAAQQSRRKRKKEVSENEGAFGLIYGLAILVGGLGMLTILVPSLLLSYVTVSPDKVVIRDSLLWLTGSARVIPFDDIASLNLEERQVASRRGMKIKKYLHIGRLTGVGETIEMQAMHRDAWPDWEAKYQAFVQSRQIAGGPAVSPPPAGAMTATSPSQPNTASTSPGDLNSSASPIASEPAAAVISNSQPSPVAATSPAMNSQAGKPVPTRPKPTLENPGPEDPDFAHCRRGYKILAGPKKREALVVSNHGIYVRVKYQDDGSEDLVEYAETEECPGVAYGDPVDKLGFFRKGVAICVMKTAGQKMGAKVLELYSDSKVHVAYLTGQKEMVSFGQCLHPSAITGKPSVGDLIPVPDEENHSIASAERSESELGRTIRSTEKIPPDKILYAEYQKRWLPVRILQTTGRGRCQIHFVGWPSEFDMEWQMTSLKLPKE